MSSTIKGGLLIALLATCALGCGRRAPTSGHGPIRALPATATRAAEVRMVWFSMDERPHRAADLLALTGADRDRRGGRLIDRVMLAASAVAPAHPFPLVRLAFAELARGGGRARLEDVLAIAGRLGRDARDDPDRLFLDGYLRWIVADAVETDELARDGMASSWSRLIEEHPGYRGPAGVDANWIREQLRVK